MSLVNILLLYCSLISLEKGYRAFDEHDAFPPLFCVSGMCVCVYLPQCVVKGTWCLNYFAP